MTQLRIPLGDGCLVCDGFRLQVAGKPSLDFDGDLLWAIEQRIWRPLAVEVSERADGVYVQPLPLARQPAFGAQQVSDWRGDAVRVGYLADLHTPAQVRDWCRGRWQLENIPDEAFETVRYTWGQLLRLDCRRAGIDAGGCEYFLLPQAQPCVYLGHLALDWRRLRFELSL